MSTTAGRLIDYMSELELTGGDHDGSRLQLLPWERRFIRGVWGRGKGGAAGLSLGRGNGKSMLVAALAAALVDPAGPLHRRRAEVLVTASSFNQARIVFEDAAGFLADVVKRDGRTAWRVQDSANMASLTHRGSGARVRCMGSDPRRLHGARPSLILADEPAQWEPGKSDRAHAALD